MATGLRTVVQNDLLNLGGNWITAFFLVGLLISFVRVGLGRLRVFLLFCLALLSCVQALARIHVPADATAVSSDNLLVLLAPLVFIYGVGTYSVLLDQIELPYLQLRSLITGSAVILVSAPLIFSLLPPKTSPVAFPPTILRSCNDSQSG